jgi:hypothetical protein
MTGKHEYKFDFRSLDWTYTGPGGGFANYDADMNILAESSTHTISKLNVVENNGSQSAEFWLEFTPELMSGDIVIIAFRLRYRVIDDGTDVDLYRLSYIVKEFTLTVPYSAVTPPPPPVSSPGVSSDPTNSSGENNIATADGANTTFSNSKLPASDITKAIFATGGIALVASSSLCNKVYMGFIRMF